MLAGAPKELVDAAGRFAFNFGMTFQITDDVLDLFSEEGQTGKPRGLDIKEGVYTLPVIYALRADDGSLRGSLSNDGNIDEAAIDFIAERVEESGGLAYALERARDYHRRALENLSELPESDSQSFLERIADKVISRQF
jgi:heptaprenyl diphosphate synthase